MNTLHIAVTAALLFGGVVGIVSTVVRLVRVRDRQASARNVIRGGMFLGVFAAGCWSFTWVTNSIVPVFNWEPSTPTAAPGETVEITLPIGYQCGISHRLVYRPQRLGRWALTHYDGQERSRKPQGIFTLGACKIDDGPDSFTIPDTVRPGTVALCDLDGNCARVEIVEGEAASG